jgi:hypothetical protein
VTTEQKTATTLSVIAAMNGFAALFFLMVLLAALLKGGAA